MVNAERAVIGTLLLYEGKDIGTASVILKPEHFESSFYSSVYRCFLNAYNNNKEISLATVQDYLQRDNIPDDLIDSYLKDCLSYNSDAAFKTNCETVYKAWQVRQYKQILSQSDSNIPTITDDIAQRIQQLAELTEVETKASIQSLADIAETYRGSYFTKEKKELLRMPFPSLDKMVGGLEPGDVIIIAARPAVGKSAFVAQLALTFARNDKRIGFYSLEMKPKQLYERFLALSSGLNLNKIRGSSGFDCNEEREMFDDGNDFLSRKNNLFIIEGSKSVSDIKRESKYMNYDVLIVDYLQLLNPDNRYKGNRAAEVGEISKGLKDIAMSLNIPVIALSQLNRVSAGKTFTVPTMAELRESGNLEQDASIVILLWNKSEDGKQKGLKVDKSRQSMYGEITLNYDGAHMTFSEENGYVPEFKDDGFINRSDINDLPWGD